MNKNLAGTRVHNFRVYFEDKLIDNLDNVEYDATLTERDIPPTFTDRETGERVWCF